MKKLSTLLAAVAICGASFVSKAETYAMPGTYQDWTLGQNEFTDNGDGTWSQTIADLYGDFKIICYDGNPAWGTEWCSNGSKVENNVPYAAAFGGQNIYMAGENAHYLNAKVTITPGANNALTILVVAESVITGEETWQMMGAEPFTWAFTTAPKFTKGADGVWTLAFEGTVADDFKPAKNGAWGNCYTTEGPIKANEDIVIAAPKDPAENMTPADGPWENPIFTIKDNGANGIVFRVTVENAGIDAVAADAANAANGPVVYYNLQGQRVDNPANGLYIRVQGDKAVKVAL